MKKRKKMKKLIECVQCKKTIPYMEELLPCGSCGGFLCEGCTHNHTIEDCDNCNEIFNCFDNADNGISCLTCKKCNEKFCGLCLNSFKGGTRCDNCDATYCNECLKKEGRWPHLCKDCTSSVPHCGKCDKYLTKSELSNICTECVENLDDVCCFCRHCFHVMSEMCISHRYWILPQICAFCPSQMKSPFNCLECEKSVCKKCKTHPTLCLTCAPTKVDVNTLEDNIKHMRKKIKK